MIRSRSLRSCACLGVCAARVYVTRANVTCPMERPTMIDRQTVGHIEAICVLVFFHWSSDKHCARNSKHNRINLGVVKIALRGWSNFYQSLDEDKETKKQTSLKFHIFIGKLSCVLCENS